MDDSNIVELYLERSESAIKETSRRYGRYCKTIAMNILNDVLDAEECVNDTYLKLWKCIPPKKPNPLSTYIGRITRNLSLDRYEYKKAQKRNSEFDLLLSEVESWIPAPMLETEYEEGKITHILNEFLYSLDYEAQTIFVHRYYFSYSIKDIAKMHDMSESKVTSMLFRARNKLRVKFEGEDVEI